MHRVENLASDSMLRRILVPYMDVKVDRSASGLGHIVLPMCLRLVSEVPKQQLNLPVAYSLWGTGVQLGITPAGLVQACRIPGRVLVRFGVLLCVVAATDRQCCPTRVHATGPVQSQLCLWRH
jgi:hypothetical protein